jgi:hypothetical protein
MVVDECSDCRLGLAEGSIGAANGAVIHITGAAVILSHGHGVSIGGRSGANKR